MTGRPRKRKHKQPRKKTTGRVGTILLRKEKRKKKLEDSKYIEVNGGKILKPQWRVEKQ